MGKARGKDASFEERYRFIELMDKTMRLMKRGRDFVRTWRHRAPEVRKQGNVYSRRKGRVGRHEKLDDVRKELNFTYNLQWICLTTSTNHHIYEIIILNVTF